VASGLERRRLEHAERDVPQAGHLSHGIAVVPKPQPQYYTAWYQEIYMRTPATIPRLPHLCADQLRRRPARRPADHYRLGRNQHAHRDHEGLVDRLIALGKRFDYFVYPNRDTGSVRASGLLFTCAWR